MNLFLVGLGLFVLGAILNAIGWTLHRRSIAGVTDNFFKWLLEVIRNFFDMLTGPNSDLGQRLAAFGAILSAIGIVAMVVGMVSLLAGK